MELLQYPRTAQGVIRGNIMTRQQPILSYYTVVLFNNEFLVCAIVLFFALFLVGNMSISTVR
jgi:hypothetical protein